MAEEQQTESRLPTDDSLDETDVASTEYLLGDVLLKHLHRQSLIVQQSVEDLPTLPPTLTDLCRAYERTLFSPKEPPKRQENGTCEPNAKLNFYPTFMLPETLATYHIFFQNQKIPLSCKANRTNADRALRLREGDVIPDFPTVESVKKIFEGLGDSETRAPHALEDKDTALPELQGDNPRVAVFKRLTSLTHFAYPAIHLPPKVMGAVMDTLILKKIQPVTEEGAESGEEPAVSDAELRLWLGPNSSDEELMDRRKTMLAVVLVSAQLECMARFFTKVDVVKKIGETLHYMFRHGYVKQACEISGVELSNMVSYMGILHENRLGQAVLHQTLQGELRRDYIRDTIYLFLIYTWQTGMGIWQQCLESDNVKELEKILKKKRRALWSGFDEKTIAGDLADIIFPGKLLDALQAGLPDFTSQSMMQNFRSFVLERSGILPAVCSALPSDFVPVVFKECPPPMWCYTYLLRLANYFMYHNDLASETGGGEGLMACHCACNLCTPHRSLITNTALLNETQTIGTFEIQGPPDKNGVSTSLKLTPGMWTSAYLRKFVARDYHAHKLAFFENQSNPTSAELTACVITQTNIVAQLQAIKKAREEFLLKKGHGVYLDPHTGEELNTSSPSSLHNAAQESGSTKAQKGTSRRAGRGKPRRGLRHQHDVGGPFGRGGGAAAAATTEKESGFEE
ncbi:100K [Tree shrew adenovirus 1]|uniref:Shutoff protein n=1 Tax=Tree shrew adenovirus serotype 1 TaxID=47680 RepID=A0A2U9AG88_ADET1|nr:100K [Tree shrew adenovirus 1]